LNKGYKRIWFFVVFLLLAGSFHWGLRNSGERSPERPAQNEEARAIPVETSAVERGPITLRRDFTGTLEPHAQFVVAPKVSGRVENITVNISDSVTRGQVVAQLDNDEFVQALAQARADLEVARAKRIEAQSALETARRDLKRIRTLRERGVASESQLDAVLAEETARNAALEVAKSQVVRAEATVRTAEIRLGYTRVTADWSGGGDRRVVAERHVDEGETVSANAALLRIVELAPLTGVFFVTEKNYALLHPGQAVSLTTDAFPGESFAGRISRIAPVFQSETRQARVEVEVDNKDLKLKPGMFIRASVALAHKNEATLVPEQAVTTRDGETGLFLIDASGASVSWRTVETGIHAEGLVEVMDPHLSGDVVVMGHQLLVDGAAVLRVEEFPSAAGDLQQAPQL